MGLGSFMYWFMYYQGEKLPKLSKTIQNHQVHVVIGSDWSDFDVLIHIIPPISIIHQIHQIQIPQIPQIPQISASIWRGHGAQLSRRPARSALHGGDQHDVCGARWTGETCVGSSRRR